MLIKFFKSIGYDFFEALFLMDFIVNLLLLSPQQEVIPYLITSKCISISHND